MTTGDLDKLRLKQEVVIWWVGSVKCFIKRLNWSLWQIYHVNYASRRCLHIGFETYAGAALRRSKCQDSPLRNAQNISPWKILPQWYWKVARIETRKLRNRVFEQPQKLGKEVTTAPKFRVIEGQGGQVIPFPVHKIRQQA